MASLTPETQKRLERTLMDYFKGAEVTYSSVSVGASGEVSVDELLLRTGSGTAWAIYMDSQEERIGLKRFMRYVGHGGKWQEVTAQDLTEEDL